MDKIDQDIYETLIAIKVMADRLAIKIQEMSELEKALKEDIEIKDMLS